MEKAKKKKIQVGQPFLSLVLQLYKRGLQQFSNFVRLHLESTIDLSNGQQNLWHKYGPCIVIIYTWWRVYLRDYTCRYISLTKLMLIASAWHNYSRLPSKEGNMSGSSPKIDRIWFSTTTPQKLDLHCTPIFHGTILRVSQPVWFLPYDNSDIRTYH